MKKITLILASIALIVSCNKEEQEEPNNSTTTTESCGINQGEFEINFNGTNHVMVPDASTQFTIVYNWYNANANDFVIMAKDQNGKEIYIEAILPNEFTTGTQTYNSNNVDSFDIDLDTNGYYVSTVTFNLTECNLDNQGIYNPIKGSFNGIAHSYPWSNGQPPIDTLSFSGSLCLNGLIIQ
ncbi:MAG: hypothetical protein ACWA41_07685 [Putridiphycobacter sp.]